VLGAAAGGGLPQWNCGCANCNDARAGRIEPRTQSSVVIGDDRGQWFLVNASPDLPAQILSFPELHPETGTLRGTPIAGILLTNADLDHVLGLFLLREGGRLHVYAPNAVRETLDNSIGLTPVLDSFCGIAWHIPSGYDFAPLESEHGKSSLFYRAIGLPGKPPLFAKGKTPDETQSVAYQFLEQRTGKRVLVAPDVGECNAALSTALQESDAVLFDGTFWSGDELAHVKTQARTAADMGHLTIKDGSLALLGGLRAQHKIYIHINNTNPVLSPGSPEQAAVAAAGIEVGYDGLEFEL
jgi:pyrroloquinoline quinone biosynthesis protein B